MNSRCAVTLLLGPTGVNKRQAADQLVLERAENGGAGRKIHFVDFERDHLRPRYDGELFKFLDESETHQRSVWREAWTECASSLPTSDAADVVVGLHGVFVRDFYGVRSLVDIPAVATLEPCQVITLIDDVYSMWHRTQARAEHAPYVGRPTIGQLIDARRSELLLGDLIAAHVPGRAPPHRLLAVKHPARTLERLLRLDAREIASVYISFPISAPRRSAEQGGPAAIAEVNSFLTAVAEADRAIPAAVTYNPLTVDELPLTSALPSQPVGETFDFAVNARWNVRDFWRDDRLLGEDPAEVIEADTQQVRDAAGAIRADIRVRDYRLVAQARAVLALNPVYEAKLASGVRNEISLAAYERQKPVHIFQDSVHDPEFIARKTFVGESGALGALPRGSYITFHDSADEAIAAAFRNASANNRDEVSE